MNYLTNIKNNPSKILSAGQKEERPKQISPSFTGATDTKLIFKPVKIWHAGIIFDEQNMPNHVFAGKNKYLYNLQLNSINNYPALTGARQMNYSSHREDIKIDFCLCATPQDLNLYLPNVKPSRSGPASGKSSPKNKGSYENYQRESN